MLCNSNRHYSIHICALCRCLPFTPLIVMLLIKQMLNGKKWWLCDKHNLMNKKSHKFPMSCFDFYFTYQTFVDALELVDWMIHKPKIKLSLAPPYSQEWIHSAPTEWILFCYVIQTFQYNLYFNTWCIICCCWFCFVVSG